MFRKFTVWFLVLLIWALAAFPLPLEREWKLFQGVHYRRLVRSLPERVVVHIAEVDLRVPGIRIMTTPGVSTIETPARTTSAFLRSFGVQIAVNGSSFTPFHSTTPWDFAPRTGDVVNITGEAISAGYRYSNPQPGWPVLCFSEEPRASIVDATCPAGTEHAIAGMSITARNGELVNAAPNVDQDLNPRTAVGVDKAGTRLMLAVADGRQPLYSAGIRSRELARFLLELGARDVIEFDGGGSSAMVFAGWLGPNALNSPIHTRIPGRQRPVGNHLGFFAKPLEETEKRP